MYIYIYIYILCPLPKNETPPSPEKCCPVPRDGSLKKIKLLQNTNNIDR